MTVTRFCEVEGVSPPSFYAWRRKLNGKAAGSAGESQPAFQPVVVTPTAGDAPGLVVRLASGAEIAVGAGHLEVIRAVVGELARVECAFAAGEDAAC